MKLTPVTAFFLALNAIALAATVYYALHHDRGAATYCAVVAVLMALAATYFGREDA